MILCRIICPVGTDPFLHAVVVELHASSDTLPT